MIYGYQTLSGQAGSSVSILTDDPFREVGPWQQPFDSLFADYSPTALTKDKNKHLLIDHFRLNGRVTEVYFPTLAP